MKTSSPSTDSAPLISVFVIIIGSKTLHPNTTIGAVYQREMDARLEVERLQKANGYCTAHYVERQVGV